MAVAFVVLIVRYATDDGPVGEIPEFMLLILYGTPAALSVALGIGVSKLLGRKWGRSPRPT